VGQNCCARNWKVTKCKIQTKIWQAVDKYLHLSVAAFRRRKAKMALKVLLEQMSTL